MSKFSLCTRNGMHNKGRQEGATLIEILVTVLIVAFALLGIAGLQLASVKFQQTSHARGTAVSLVENIAERIRTNAAALQEATATSAYIANDAYANAATLPTDPGCGITGTVCTPAESAQQDLREWRQLLASELPGGRGALQTISSGALTVANARRVIVMWVEKAQNSDDNLGAAPTDSNCPTPWVAGVRCLALVVHP